MRLLRFSGFYYFHFAFIGAFAPYWSFYLQTLVFNVLEIGVLISLQISVLMSLLMITRILIDNTNKRGSEFTTPYTLYMPEKKPPEKYIKSLQLDLFSQFVTNDKSEVSNTVEIWESIPKYFLTPAQVKKLRTDTGHADPYEWNYTEKGSYFTVRIQPALIKQGNNKYQAFFPGITEELVEEALKKILTIQNHGIHDVNKVETWVRFSLRMVLKELASRGRDRNINQIKHAIEVMSSCVISLSKEKKEIWKGSILQDLVTVGREEYLADTDAQHIGRLPLFISHAINRLEYRQFNYDRLMSCDEQLSRFIYKKLINRYRHANLINNYHFMFSDLKNSGLLQQSREIDNRRKVLSALDELKEKNIIASYETDERKESRAITDVKYTIFPSNQFISEQKAANKRVNDTEKQINDISPPILISN